VWKLWPSPYGQSIVQMDRGELKELEAAINRPRANISHSGVVERRPYANGVLQLEYRTNPKTGNERGPHWYFKWRENGKQRTKYVGLTDDPVSRADEMKRS
jgi:hypothetical protein